MRTYKIELSVPSGFITPWHSDTIFGHLCWVAERHDGFTNFSGAAEFIDLYRGETPPLVLSDAFPAGYLPAPANLKEYYDQSMKGDLDVDRYSLLKKVKAFQYLTLEQFLKYQNGEMFDLAEGEGSGQMKTAFTLHNQINRLSNTTGDSGSLFELEERFVCGGKLDIYARIAEGFEGDAMRLFELFAAGGFGRKKSTGKGAFNILSFKEYKGLDVVENPKEYLSLSHFVPAQSDPTDGTYKVMVKYGKMGEDKALGGNPFKKPLMMIKPGAVFRAESWKPYYGRLIENIAYACSEVVQYGFAFSVPVKGFS